jgi:formate C-acetyltransferase
MNYELTKNIIMNERIKQLREKSLCAENKVSDERALLITEFYKSQVAGSVSEPVKRALSLKYILKYKRIYIDVNELIIGERGPEPKAVPSYPEVCLHSLEDLEILHNRTKVSFKVSDEVRKSYTEIIIPFWQGKTNRDKIFASMTSEWLESYKAGVFTEFQEQRSPGHTVCGEKIYHKGMLDIIEDIHQAKQNLDYINDASAYDKNEELNAMEISAQAIIMFANRHADELERLANLETNQDVRTHLLKLSEISRKIPAHAPSDFHEALQYYWYVHLGVITETNPWDSFNPGRLDQHLFPFYRKQILDGTITPERAKELLQAFWIKFNNHPAPPKVGVTALESNTYTDFALINLGGIKPDGSDAVNELTYLILDVIEEMRLLQPSSMVQVSKKNPDNFVKRAVRIVKTGFGQPSIFNTDAIVQELVNQGKQIEDARRGGASGCVEAGAFGTEAYFLSGYFNIPKVLEITLHNGVDPRTGKKIGIETGNPAQFFTFNDLLDAFRMQLNYFVTIKIKGNNTIERIWAKNIPVPFLSLLIDDCITNGMDYNNGGARYNTTYIQGVGLGTMTDSLTAIRYHVFDNNHLSMQTFLQAMDANFEDFTDLRRSLVYDTPKFGNDNDYADQQAVKVFDLYYDAINGKPNTRRGFHRINLLPTTCHIYFGSVIQALPDGRLAGKPLSEGISPVQGADSNGPTAVVRSAAKIDHIKTGGTLLNQKFAPSFFKDESALDKVVGLVRGYFRMDGHHIQFNVVSSETLRDAQKFPERYRDLIVRVAGYSDYFNDLGADLQEEVIRRTEHEAL